MRTTTMAAEGVDGSFDYVSPTSGHNLRYVGGGREVNTGAFDRHTLFVRDARQLAEPPTLDSHGFTLLRHDTSVDFYDPGETAYPAEIERVLLSVTGADKAVLFGPRRRHMTQSEGDVLQGAVDVHVDYAAPDSQRLARQLLGSDDTPYRRVMAINIWRSLTAPPQDRPLAVCDARSVASQSGAFNTLMLVDEMPPRAAMLTEPPDEPGRRRGFLFHFDPAHRWYYYKNMMPDEILLFKLYDSTETGAWRCPHASFADPTVTAAPPRESYEIRSFVYFT